jgi:hypothetical protein
MCERICEAVGLGMVAKLWGGARLPPYVLTYAGLVAIAVPPDIIYCLRILFLLSYWHRFALKN